ncbi:MAG: hypothetical protein AB8I08_33360 [Sandaracinaceae bacterium]
MPADPTNDANDHSPERVDPAAIQAALLAASQADSREALWSALEPVAAAVTEHADLALLWGDALRTSPGRRTLETEANLILDAFPAEPAIVARVCAALIRAAERRPVDEPPLADGPASIAASALSRCMGKLAPDGRLDPDVGGRLAAQRGTALGLLGPNRHAEAVGAIESALSLASRGDWWGDLAIVQKRGRDFSASLEAAKKARAALGNQKPVLWNLAIAATATGDGELAAEAWAALGLPVERVGDGLPFVEGLEPAQVRLPTVGAGHGLAPFVPDEAAGFELVWVQPLSPCHGVVRSPTFRDAMADFGDVVLWDGAPVGVSEIDGKAVPRFPLLSPLHQGDERRFRFLTLEQEEGQTDALGAALEHGAILYRHGERVEHVCPRCAAGETLIKHEHLPAETHRIAFGKLVLAGDVDLETFARHLERTRRDHPGVRMAIPSLYEALGETKNAGTHHKRWGTIERTAMSGSS